MFSYYKFSISNFFKINKKNDAMFFINITSFFYYYTNLPINKY